MHAQWRTTGRTPERRSARLHAMPSLAPAAHEQVIWAWPPGRPMSIAPAEECQIPVDQLGLADPAAGGGTRPRASNWR